MMRSLSVVTTLLVLSPARAEPPRATELRLAQTPVMDSLRRQPDGRPEPPPPPRIIGYSRKPNVKLIIAGSVLFGFSYGAAVAFGVTQGPYDLTVPIVGPLLHLGRFGAPDPAFAVIDAIAQTAGLAMLITGLSWWTRQPIYEHAVIVPVSSPTMIGVALVSRF